MSKQNKWKMNRAGLLNFWYYDDEIFDFADGKLLLRGSNGSGKSVTMQSILPILLDGKKTPDRLDPFGSRARKIEDYLLGEKEIVDRDERTGYLFLEYKREDTNQYMTTGIGLQARRYKSLNFWGFIITDNRRIGKDFHLYEYEHHAGEKQQIPLSRVQLENRIGTGGHVVRTQGDYMKLVNKYIFGFETLEAYEDLIKLLIQLRSPKLSKDFRPTVIYEILEAALPPLTDEDLRHLSDTIEHMDQTKQQIEQLEREQAALDQLIKRYDTYNAYRLAETAHHYVDAKKKLSNEEKITMEKREQRVELEQQHTTLTDRNKILQQQEHVLEQKQKRLSQHKVWSLEEDRTEKLKQLTEVEQSYNRNDKAVISKTKQERQTKERLDEILERISSFDKKMTDQLLDLEADAEETSFKQHFLNAEDFERHKQHEFDFTVWKKEAQSHFERLDQMSEQLRSYEQMKEQIADIEKVMADTELEIDQMRQEERDWVNVFEKDKQEKVNEIYKWAEDHDHVLFNMDVNLMQQASRDLLKLYEPVTYETIRKPFYHAHHHYQQHIHEKIATQKSERTKKRQYKEELEQQLLEWKDKRDPEPPFQREETKRARSVLEAAQLLYVPFYEAVEFQDHVDEKTRRHIEAALIDTGLLDALITVDERVELEHDRVIKPNPQIMAHTLADYLVPDLNDGSKIPVSRVDDVLHTILVDDDDANETAVIHVDGTYQIGIVKGHAVPVKTVRFIGKNARKRYREEEIERLTAEIEAITIEEQQIQDEINVLEEHLQAAQAAMESFPNDEDLQEAYKQIESIRFKIEQLQKQLIGHDQKYRDLLQSFQVLKRKLDEATRELTIDRTHSAYVESKQIQLRYERDLNKLENVFVTFRHEQRMKEQTEVRLQELEDEIDGLIGERNVVADQLARLKQTIAEIEYELKNQGMEDIRQQIQSVQKQLSETKMELDRNKYALPQIEADLKNVTRDITQHEQKIRFYHAMVNAWSSTFSEESQYQFVSLPEEIETIDDQAKWMLKEYKHLLKDSSKIEEQLTKAYFEQHANLIEYRMTEFTTATPSVPNDEEWTDEQHILLANWKQKATRRLIELDFQGKRLSPYSVRDIVEEDYSRQRIMLDDQDRQLYEDILFDSVGKKLRSRIHRAEKWTKQMNDLMMNSNSTSGISFSIQWKPRTAETETELDTKELVDLLRRNSRLLKEENINQVMDHFRTKIERAKELIDIKGEGHTLLQVLKEVLDYRYWFSFVLSYQRTGEPKRELTNNAFYKFSGGEKAMAMYIPLFTACYSRYLEADPAAPYIISLDEAFAGVDDDNISVMFRIVEELGFDYIMNSQVLWGDYETVSSLSICELIRPKNANFVSVIRYLWDGKKRKLVVDQQEEADESKEQSLIEQ